MELLQNLPPSHLEQIQASLITGLQPYNPDNVSLDLHKPFKTTDGKIVGQVMYDGTNPYDSPAFIEFSFIADGQRSCAKTYVRNSDGEFHIPRHNREAAVCVYAMCNRALGKRLFEGLGKAWETELSPFIGGV